MATFRTVKEDGDFVLVHKGFIYDSNISAKAKGILLYLLSRPNNWKIYTSEIQKHMTDGLKAVNSGVNELIAIGYIERKQTRKDNGDFGEYEYYVYEKPKKIRGMPFGESAKMENAKMENAVGENAKGQATNNNSTNNDLTNNDSNKNNSSSKQQSPFDFYQSNGFGVLKPYISEQIGAWIDDFKENGNEIVIEAMKESLNNNVYKWNYVNSILKSWFNDGIKSVEDISARNNKRSKQEEVADEDNPYLKYMNN
ncbi:DnaD domain protein [Mammaliicoccus sciuri]|uniref:DnaD domain protein n=1 Tax=Mammaliicoccus sciuri TaxID=1296 RepID=UPI0027FDEDB9|nr:DnaD domain protein [Mammaliicoccus sciuri]MDQ7129505.1 DnaD domain protein [Mammaliicoccus sciuri]